MTDTLPADSDVQRYCVDGELNIYTAGEQKPKLIAQLEQATEFELDLSGVTEFDSAGLQLLLAIQAEARRQDRGFHLINPGTSVCDVLDLLDLRAQFGVAQPAPAQEA
jgi:anti-anti-sigma factor